MRTTSVQFQRGTSGFTLIEMIGVLSVIAILASLLVPRVMQAISDARVNEAVASCDGVKIAINQYYGRYTRLGGANGSDLGIPSPGSIYPDWDALCLVPEGCLDRPFQSKIGNGLRGATNNGAQIRVINIAANTPTTAIANDGTAINLGAYNRNGTGAINDVIGSWVVEACLEGVDNVDAIELSRRLDGPTLGAAPGENDEVGRVKYFLNADGSASVRVYLSHR